MSGSKLKVPLPRTRCPKTTPNERGAKGPQEPGRTVAKRKTISADSTKERVPNQNGKNVFTKFRHSSMPGSLDKENNSAEVLNLNYNQQNTANTAASEKEQTECVRVEEKCMTSDIMVNETNPVSTEHRLDVKTDVYSDKCDQGVDEIPTASVKECKVEKNKILESSNSKNSESLPLKLDTFLNADSSRESVLSPSISGKCGTKSKLSFLKAKSVITDSCVPNQTSLMLSGVNENACNIMNTPEKVLSNSSTTCDTNQNTVKADVPENTSDLVIPSSVNDRTTVSESNGGTKSKGTSFVKPAVRKIVPSYQRMTLSFKNKDNKTKTHESKSASSKLKPTKPVSSDTPDQPSSKSARNSESGLRKNGRVSTVVQMPIESTIDNRQRNEDRIETVEINGESSKTATEVRTLQRSRSKSLSHEESTIKPTSQNRNKSVTKPKVSLTQNRSPNNGETMHPRVLKQTNGKATLNLKRQRQEDSKAVDNKSSESSLKGPVIKNRAQIPKPSSLSIKRGTHFSTTRKFDQNESKEHTSQSDKNVSKDMGSCSTTSDASGVIASCRETSNLKKKTKSEQNACKNESISRSTVSKKLKESSCKEIYSVSDPDNRPGLSKSGRNSTNVINADSKQGLQSTANPKKEQGMKNSRDLKQRSRSTTQSACQNASPTHSKRRLSNLDVNTSKSKLQERVRVSSSRSRSTTPGASSTTSTCSSDTRYISKRAHCDAKQKSAQTTQKINRDSNSRSRSSTPGAVFTSSTNKGTKTTTQSSKQISKSGKESDRDSSSKSRSSTPSVFSTSGSTKVPKEMISKTKCEEPIAGQKSSESSSSRSCSTTPGSTSSYSDNNTNFSKEIISKTENKVLKSGQKSNRSLSSMSRLTTHGALSTAGSVAERDVTKQTISYPEKRQSKGKRIIDRESSSRSRSTTPGSPPSGSDIDTKLSKGTVLKYRKENGMTGQKTNRDLKSRSRSTTPGSSSTSSGDLNLRSSSRQTSIILREKGSDKSIKSDKQTISRRCSPDSLGGRTSMNKSSLAIKRQNSLIKNYLTCKHLSSSTTARGLCVSSSRNTKSSMNESTQQKARNHTSEANCREKKSRSRSSTPDLLVMKSFGKTGENTRVDSYTQSSKAKAGAGNNCTGNVKLSSTKRVSQSKMSNIPINAKLNSTTKRASILIKPRQSQTAARSATTFNFQRETLKSSNSLTTPDSAGSKLAENKTLPLSERENICRNKKQSLSTGMSDKRALRSTKLSIKPDSRKSVGKMSAKNKSPDSIQTSSENRNNSLPETIDIQRKVNKTFVNDNKSRKTASLSVIKRHNVSTTWRNKSEQLEASKQKARETECLCTNEKEHNVSLNSDRNELISSGKNDTFSAGEATITDGNFKHITENDCSNKVSSDQEINMETSTQFGNVTNSGLTKDNQHREENVCNEKNEHLVCKECIVEEYKFSPDAEFTDINFADPEENARDPKSKVSSKYLLDREEYNYQQVKDGLLGALSSMQKEHRHFSGELNACCDRNCTNYSTDKMEIMHIKTENGKLNNEMICESTSDDCLRQKDISLQELNNKVSRLCDKCKEINAGHCISGNDNEIFFNFKCSCIDSYGEDFEGSNKIASIENNKIVEDSLFEISQDLKYQNDKSAEVQTFEIKTCDINSSQKVPISEGRAFKHTEFADSRKDKAKCTDAAPVTGATSLQISNKRQDRKSASLLTCSLRNQELFSTRNGFLHKDYENSATQRNTETGQKYSDVISKCDTDGNHKCEMFEVKNSLSDSKRSLAFEHGLSDWQNTQFCDRLCSKNMTEIQVMNNSELNKETSEPGNIYRKLNGDDILDILNCDKMDTSDRVNHTNSDANQISCHLTECDRVLDLHSQIPTEAPTENVQLTENAFGNLDYAASSKTVLKMCPANDDGIKCNENNKLTSRDMDLLQTGHSDTCAPMSLSANHTTPQNNSAYHSNDCLTENSQTLLTCEIQDVENICCLDEKNILPERNSRTDNAKLINTEHDLSNHASCTCKNTSQTTNEPNHSEIQIIRHSETCKSKQFHLDHYRTCEKVSSSKDDFSGTPPRDFFLQNHLRRFKPDGLLSENEDQGSTSGTPYVSGVQGKQTDCLDYASDSESLFSQQAITEDRLVMTKCNCVSKFPEQSDCIEDSSNTNDHCSCCNLKSEAQQFSNASKMADIMSDMHKREKCAVQNKTNLSFSEVPKLSECIYKTYPNLISQNAACNEITFEKEINHENLQCSNMTQTANINNSSISMKLNDSACLFQHYKHSDGDDINVSNECEYCAGLLQTSEEISNDNPKMLHTQHGLNGIHSTEQVPFKNTENNLCTGSTPCDGSILQISTLINREKSSEYHELNDLSQLFDDHEDNTSCGIMSRDHARASTEGAELNSECSTELTGCETLENYNRTSYQDGFQDKPSSLSPLISTTQENSCNLVFSEKISEPKDFMLRYERKNSSGQTKFYSCKDELDTNISSTQEENYFRNLAANRDEDINYEIKSNNLNIETTTHCDASSVECSKTNFGNQGQCKETVQDICSTGDSKCFDSQKILSKFSNYGEIENRQTVCKDNVGQNADTSATDIVLNGDITFSSITPEHNAGKDTNDNRNIENGCLHVHSIISDETQTGTDLNNKLPSHNEEFKSPLNTQSTLSSNASGVIKAENKIENWSNNSDNLQSGINVACVSGQHSDSQDIRIHGGEIDIGPNTGETVVFRQLDECANRLSETENVKIENLNSLETIDKTAISDTKDTVTHSRNSVNFPLDESLSDTSEAFTDAEDRINSPYLENNNSINVGSTGSDKYSNISCRDSTSTESFADAVESLDDDYLTTVTYRHSREIQNEENLSQSSSGSDESTTSVIGSMEDLSGWEEFSESITDLQCCVHGEMETRNNDVTNNNRNVFQNLTDGQSHVPVREANNRFYDNHYQKPSPILESNEIYPSVIKANTLRYKGMRNDAEQKVIGNSNFETGNGGLLEGNYDTSLKGETDISSNPELQDAGGATENSQGGRVLHGDTTGQTAPENMTNKAESKPYESHAAVGSKIETAVMKRTQRRRRRQLFEQQKNNISTCSAQNLNENDKATSETSKSKLIRSDNTCDKGSIEKRTHSQHFENACTISDNMTSYNEPASGTEVLSEQVNTISKLDEFDLNTSSKSETPLNYDSEERSTKINMGIDKAFSTDCVLGSKENESILIDSENSVNELIAVNENDNVDFSSKSISDYSEKVDYYQNCELKTSMKIVNESKQNETSAVSFENESQFIIEIQEQGQSTDAEFDDIEFIDADDLTNDNMQTEIASQEVICKNIESATGFQQDKSVSPNASFSFTFEEDSTESVQLTDEVKDSVLQNTASPEEEKVGDNESETKQSELFQTSETCQDHDGVVNNLKDAKLICDNSNPETNYSVINESKLHKDEICDLLEHNSNVTLLGQQGENEEGTMHVDICEESNISVKHALEIEKQNLAHNTDIRSRKDLFAYKRTERRATIDNGSFEDKNSESSESVTDSDKTTKGTIKKSQSFRSERKEISPVASFMNPQVTTDVSEMDEQTESVNKKVSDICRSFMTKTRASVQRSRAQSTSKSPAPQRKLMKWVNNQGKWMRIPVDETLENRNELKDDRNDITKTSTGVEERVQETSTMSSDTNTNAGRNRTGTNRVDLTEISPPSNITLHSPVVDIEPNATQNTGKTEKIDTSFNKQHIADQVKGPNYHQADAVKADTENKSIVESGTDSMVSTANNGLTCFRNKDKSSNDIGNGDILKPRSHTNEQTERNQPKYARPIKGSENKIKELTEYSMKKTAETETSSLDAGRHQALQNSTFIEASTALESTKNETENDLEVKVIGTTLNDEQCDQEKHLKRQELLFGLLNSYYRRKPRRFTHQDASRSLQNSPCSTLDRNKKKNENEISDASNSVRDETIEKQDLFEGTKTIPKIKCVKIQEEIFECKKEYLKDSNLISSSNFEESNSDAMSFTSKRRTDVQTTEMKLRQPLRKSKTFAGLGDIERQKDILREYAELTVRSETKTLPRVTVKHEYKRDTVHDPSSFSRSPSSKMVDKRSKAGLKLNLEKAKNETTNKFHSDLSPSRPTTDKPRGRPQCDRSPNRLCVEQPRFRVRSPEMGPKQRAKLLSEIVEVEENKGDISGSYDRQHQQRHYRDRHKQEVQKPVTRSNKRRSLSLPTGTLAFGDARIVYKNGHFTIETMDTSEYESSNPIDYRSSSSQLDDHDDDLWDTSDTSVNSRTREVTDMHNKPLMRRQNAKTVLKSSDSTEDVFYNETDIAENARSHRSNLNSESKVLNMGRADEDLFNESCSSRTSDMSVDSYSSERMDSSTDESVTELKKLSSSSLPESKDEEVKHVIQRAKRTSSFRAAQEAGSLRLSGIEEDKVHNSSRARSVSVDESQCSDLNKSPKIQSVHNQNPTFLKKVMAKRKSVNENISGFSKQSESARDFFTKKMTLKGLFRKNKSDTSVNSPLKTEHPVSPPIATFQDDDICSVDTPPSSPYRTRDLRRRHTSADILKSYPDSSETDSNCPTPTQERSSLSRNSISTPSTPSHEGSVFLNLSSQSAPPFRDEDEMSITSASSFASSIHSPPMEQPHKPKTPKPVGASPRRNSSVGSQLSRTGSQSSQRNVLNSVTSLESEQYESLKDNPRCECDYEARYSRNKSTNRKVKGSADCLTMCQFCKEREFYKSESTFSSSSLHKQQSGEKLSDESVKLRRDSSGRSNYDRLGIISQTDVASSNSNDSGIQRDASLHSSNESIKGTQDSRVRLRRNKSLSPHPDRPKSEISVKWADGDSGDYDITETSVKLRNKNLRDRPRPKSDLDGSSFLSGRMKAFGSEVNLQPYCSLRSLYEVRRHDLDKQKNRRMSTPHPIKSRLQRAPHKLQKQPPLVRSSSMPESLEKIHKRRKMHHLLDFHLDSLSRHMDIDNLSDASDLSFDRASLHERSVSVQSSTSQLTGMDEDEDNLTYAEALWDHITMDPEELGFRAQDVIEVLDMADKDWWFGVIDDREGWFPATFVRIRVNQDQLDDDLDLDATIQDNLTTSPKLRRISMFNKNQARSNVVNEIINAEREYVKHLKDVVEGYIQHARKRTEMFPEERILLIFGNIETIYSFAKKFLSQLEMCIDVCPHLSEIGQCFLDSERGFEIYSDYCNNHPSACEELDDLCKDSKYKHFFEACRLLQELVEIPLEGFLLTPVQKICKYPLQLAELLKYTPPDHPDYMKVKDALAAMRKIATLINERKRKMESIEKIAVWQQSVVDWEGADLLEGSSELIFSGELNKINTAGWSQERFFFLFDHQLVYCKKELLKRHVFSYKGRIDLDYCDIVDIPDGKDAQYNVTVKYAWKFHETHKDKWYLVYAKSEAVKQHWLKAIKNERQRVIEDQQNDFCVSDHWKQTVLNKVKSQSHIKDKQSGGRTSHGQLLLAKDLKDFTYATLPRNRISQKHDKKKGWFKFGGGKKSKR